jgi:ABC-type lipoprotein release transport system permease subunit
MISIHIVVVAIIIGLCFFMLFVSFTSNITENAWEFGVLRALGLTV